MKLVRKTGTSTLKNKEGLDIPNAIVLATKVSIDYKSKTLHIMYGLFSDVNAMTNGYEPIERGEFYFDKDDHPSEYTAADGRVYQYNGVNYMYKEGGDDDTLTPGDVVSLTQAQIDSLTKTYSGRHKFDTVYSTLSVDGSGIAIVAQASQDWVLEQPDFDGVAFGANWEVAT